ncbi:ArsR/SmtB family transcription factor [Halorarius halobius]|uniref:ArsR/SmtB family transcription factor n=1 Tax=Halorarius halobius TaxID=2962671 RepID=UPI0020CC00E4|nr:winged helix-turn-helix domain-containing protein [Halorarius halobius]
MSSESGDPDAPGLSADDAFALVGDDTRIRILRALADADGALSFSELREQVGMRDSGRFNYHLDKLRGEFVTDAEDGYRLTRPGLRLVGSILANAYTPVEGDASETATAECALCGSDATLTYRDSLLRVECDTVEDHVWVSDLPPGARTHVDLPDLLDLGARVNRQRGELARTGTCPQCFGSTTCEIVRSDEHPAPAFDEEDHEYFFRATCDRCSYPIGGLVGSLVTPHPAVVAAYHDVGVDVREEVQLPHEREPPAVESDDPLRLRIDVEHPEAGDRLVSVVVDEAGSVVDVEESGE